MLIYHPYIPMSSVQRSFFKGKKRAFFPPKNPRFFTFKPRHIVVSPSFYACPPQRVISITDSTWHERIRSTSNTLVRMKKHINMFFAFSVVYGKISINNISLSLYYKSKIQKVADSFCR